jgi:hypothetical protein
MLFLERAGLLVDHVHVGLHSGGHRMELEEWMERIGTPAKNREQLRGLFFDPPPELVEELVIERKADEVTFSLPEMTLLAHLANG